MKDEMIVENTVEDVAEDTSLGFFGTSECSSSNIGEALNMNSCSASLLNRQEYEKRLLTFQASTYYAKPPCLSPLFCARFG